MKSFCFRIRSGILRIEFLIFITGIDLVKLRPCVTEITVDIKRYLRGAQQTKHILSKWHNLAGERKTFNIFAENFWYSLAEEASVLIKHFVLDLKELFYVVS